MNHSQSVIRTIILALGLILVGCISPPHYAELGSKRSPMFGYSEQETKEGSYVLKTVYPNSSMAESFWTRRAQELCGGIDFEKNIFRQERPTVHYDTDGGRPGYFVLEGFLQCSQVEREQSGTTSDDFDAGQSEQ